MKFLLNNGVKDYVVANANPLPLPKEGPSSFWEVMNGWGHNMMEGFNNFSDSVIQSEVEFILKPVGIFFKEAFLYLVNLLNTHSVEIITLGMIAGGIGMMIAPMVGARSATWLGRVLFIGLTGSIWRVII